MNQILTASRKNNLSQSVTGILLYHDGGILQVLEGEKQTIIDLYARIKEDERHKDVIQLVHGMSAERNFPDWAMGFKAVSNKDWSEYEGYIKLDSASLLSQIKNKNLKIDTTIQSFASSFEILKSRYPKN